MKLSIQFWLSCGIALCTLATTSPTTAQIVPDATLINNSSVMPEGNTSIINGGTRQGSNLFHSFEYFSVPTNGVAFFDNALDIQNIIGRVTGSSISNIDGLIRANGAANLFLLNPNGIIFGPNARLNIGGSFLASTASAVNFADNTQFSSTAPEATPLLTVSVPIGLQFGGTAGRILVQGSGNNLSVSSSPDRAVLRGNPVGLTVKPGKTLTLVGGDVTLEGGNLIADRGRIEVGSVAGTGLVSLAPTDFGLTLGYQGVPAYGDIQLSQRASLDASGEAGGNIQVQGRRVTLKDGSAIFALTLGSQPGGSVAVNASDSVEVIGTSADHLFPSAVFADTEGAGDAGGLTINAGQLLVQNGAVITADSVGAGDGGNLIVNADTSVILSGTGTIAVDGRRITSSSSLSTTTQGNGAGGALKINTGQLLVENGAAVRTDTLGVQEGAGDGGNLTVNADTFVKLSGTSANGRPSSLLAQVGIGAIGNGGSLTINTGQLLVENGALISTATLGKGSGGTLKVNALKSVEVGGTSPDSRRLASRLTASTIGAGTAGDLRIETRELIVRDGARVTVSSTNPAPNAKGAGDIDVKAQTIRLDNGGAITAESRSGNGGNITLRNLDLLLLRRNSNLSTNAGIEDAGGTGGNIDIENAEIIVAVPSENSDIKANAFRGQGGKVTINARSIFGLVVRNLKELQTLLSTNDPKKLDPTNLPSSDITAISLTNPLLRGQVTINRRDFDPSRGLVILPETIVDISSLIASGCPASVRQGQSEFIVTGRGGLPPNPSDTLSSDTIWTDLRPQTRQAENQTISESATQPTNSTPEQLVEAQGWVINNKGEVVLVATAPTITPQTPWMRSLTCDESRI